MAVQEGPRFGARSRRGEAGPGIHWGWLGLSSIPISALLADRHLPAPWVVGLSACATLLVLLGIGLPQRAMGWTGREIVGGIRRVWETRQGEEAKVLLRQATSSLDGLVSVHAPSRGHKALPFGSQRYRRQVVLDEYEPLRAEIELAIAAAMRAGARDEGAMLLAKEPHGLRDLTALLAELRRLTIDLS